MGEEKEIVPEAPHDDPSLEHAKSIHPDQPRDPGSPIVFDDENAVPVPAGPIL